MPKMSKRGNPTIAALATIGNGPYRRHCKRIAEVVNPMRDEGKAWPEICSHLNEQSHFSFRGRRWTPASLIGAMKSAKEF